jgi:hypothetical protein
MNDEDRARVREMTARLSKPLPISQLIMQVLADGPAPACEVAASDGILGSVRCERRPGR